MQAAGSRRQDLDRSRPVLERLLTQNILPFWYPEAIDREDGGYRLNHDAHGRWKGRSSKYLVTQARTLWFFARLARSRWGTGEHLKAAEHGYEFLCRRLWDERFGGFYWEVDASGREVLAPDKHAYAQAFGLYALCEYAAAAGDGSATRLARRLFRLLEEHAHDARWGGYAECFRRDWRALRGGERGYLGARAGRKLTNTHLHLLEALTRFSRLTGDPTARARLVELIPLLGQTVVRSDIAACTDQHERDWTPLRGPAHDRVSYGHQLESLWLLSEARRAAGVPEAPSLDLERSLFAYALRYGFDAERGGFFEAGPLGASADRRVKTWWVQAEALLGALRMHERTGDDGYLDCFLATLAWIVDHQADWQHGDWHAQVSTETGAPSGDKAGAWKSPYHDGRAVLECLESLSTPAGA